jgi:hypothetical protein
MADRGVFFAVNPLLEKILLTAKDDDALLGMIQADLEEDWDVDWLQDVEDAWDALHRCLTDGTLRGKSGSPFEKCVLGGRQLYAGKDYTASYLTAAEVKSMADALHPITREWLRQRFFGLKKISLLNWHGYDGPIDEKDFETTWNSFAETKIFFRKVAQAGMAMVFTVDR